MSFYHAETFPSSHFVPEKKYRCMFFNVSEYVCNLCLCRASNSSINNKSVIQTLNKSYKLVKRLAAWLLSLALYPIFIFMWRKHFTSQTEIRPHCSFLWVLKLSVLLKKGNANLKMCNQRIRNHNESEVYDGHCRGSESLQNLNFALSIPIRQLWWKTACSKVLFVSFQQKILQNHNLTVLVETWKIVPMVLK